MTEYFNAILPYLIAVLIAFYIVTYNYARLNADIRIENLLREIVLNLEDIEEEIGRKND